MTDSGQTDSGQTSHTRFFIAGIFSALLLLSHATSFGQFDEAAELPKGLVASYSAGDRSVERLEEAISYDWVTSLPDRRLWTADGDFKGQWKSQLLVRQEGRHRIHAFVQGTIRIEINGEVVLKAESKTPGWMSGEEFTPDVGFQPLSVHFEKSADEARLQLFWSSDVFPLEPLPGHLFFAKKVGPISRWSNSVATSSKPSAAEPATRTSCRKPSRWPLPT